MGAHIDFSRHFFPEGMDAAAFPLEQLCGTCNVFHLPDAAEITKDMLKQLDIQPGDRVLFRTDNEAFDGIHTLHPVYLTAEAGEYLAERKDLPFGHRLRKSRRGRGFPHTRNIAGAEHPHIGKLETQERRTSRSVLPVLSAPENCRG